MAHPADLYTAAQIQAVDAAVIAAGTPGFTLMCRAAEVAFNILRQRWPACRRLLVLVGAGNNGGDGLVVATLAHKSGIRVQVLHCADPAHMQGAAREAWTMATEHCVPQDAFSAAAFAHALSGIESAARPAASASAFQGNALPDSELVLVDGLLGTGSSGAPRGVFADAIHCINGAGNPVLALDLPSGLNPDTGAAELVVKAAVTVSFIGLKQGLFTGHGPACCGDVILHDLAIDDALMPLPTARLISLQQFHHLFPARAADAHKGDFGRVVLVGGETGFGGAILMAAEAAARTGAGTVVAITRPAHVAPLLTRRPEVMAYGVDDPDQDVQQIDALLRSATVIVAGPGLGRTPWSTLLLQRVLAIRDIPLVLDADALNLLAEHPHMRPRANWILTPHPGEAARLLNQDTASVQADRFTAVRELQKRLGGSCLLKGAGSLVCYAGGAMCHADGAIRQADGDAQKVLVCSDGNPGMASGGMGDVLSGIIAGLAAQGLALPVALQAGVCLHARAADLAARRRGERGLLATDLLAELGSLLNPHATLSGHHDPNR